jgi:arsenate reductase
MKHVLFVCNHNAGRSQIARAFFEKHGPDDVRAESAGSKPARKLWPVVVEAMNEVGIDLTGRRPQKLTLEMQLHANWAVTMGCGDACPYVPTKVEDWEIDDPADQPIERVRQIRDEIEVRVQHLIEHELDAIRSDRTAHQLRLGQLLPDLVREFGEEKEPEDIRACADAILQEYDEVPVRSFVMSLVNRRARACLKEEQCDALVTA